MKIYAATTRITLTLKSVEDDSPRVFPAGTEVTAISLPSGGIWHLNAHHDAATYDGYAASSELDVKDVVATINE